MTIGLGMLCNDGMILAADTLFEAQNRTYGRKLWSVHYKAKPVLGWTLCGAGVDDHLRQFRGDFFREGKPARTLDELAEAAEDVVSEFYPRVVFLESVAREDYPEFLLALHDNGRSRLYTIRNGSIAPFVPLDATPPAVFIGTGSVIGEYLSALLFKPEAGVRAAEVLATYILRQTKIYAHGVGGDTDIVRIPTRGRPHRRSAESIRLDEQYFTGFMEAAAELAYVGLEETTEFEMSAKIDTLKARIDALRYDVHRGVPFPGASWEPQDDQDDEDVIPEADELDPPPPTESQ